MCAEQRVVLKICFMITGFPKLVYFLVWKNDEIVIFVGKNRWISAIFA